MKEYRIIEQLKDDIADYCDFCYVDKLNCFVVAESETGRVRFICSEECFNCFILVGDPNVSNNKT